MDIDRLSALPDDLLRRILYFAPAKEGACTAVLSRRWRSLWPTSGAVNLQWRLDDKYIYTIRDDDARERRKAFFRRAKKALASAHAHSLVRKFSLHVEASHWHNITKHLTRWRIRALLSNPAIQHVEELSIGAAETDDRRNLFSSSRTSSDPDTREFYKLSFGALPSETLGVLQITNCHHLKPPPSRATFPLLTDLCLRGCGVSLVGLQRVVDAAPRLATFRLESFSFPRGDTVDGTKDGCAVGQPCFQLLCPTVTTLVLGECNWPEVDGGLEIDAPKLQCLVYKGPVQHCHRLSLYAPAELVQVDLHLTQCKTYQHRECQYSMPFLWFWQFIQNFRNTKALKLKLDFAISLIAVVDQKGEDEILRNTFFCNLENLDLDVEYDPAGETVTMALANFLNRCPVIRDLHLKLTHVSTDCFRAHTGGVARLDFDKSVNHFRHHKGTRASMGRDYDSEKCEISDDIHGFCSESFNNCLKRHLRRVSLKFWMENPDCLGVQLAKFFARKAMVLEEMVVDDGSQKMCDHINHKIGRWIHTYSSKRKFLQSSLGFGQPYHVGKRRKHD